MAAAFLSLIDRYFPKESTLHKLINRSTVKVSYATTKNMASKINAHNKRTLNSKSVDTKQSCNCRGKKNNCPLNGDCKVESVIYKAEIQSENSAKKVYSGLTRNTFKERYYGHKSLFTYQSKSDATELSKHYWALKSKEEVPIIKWSIVTRAHTYKNGASHCDLCLTEKTVIAYADPKTMVNKRTEIFSKCRHRAKFKLKNK